MIAVTQTITETSSGKKQEASACKGERVNSCVSTRVAGSGTPPSGNICVG